MGTDDMTHGQCISSRVLHIVYTGCSHHDPPILSFALGDLAAVIPPEGKHYIYPTCILSQFSCRL